MPPKPKLLIADGSIELLKTIVSFPDADLYEIQTAEDGISCLEKFASFKPDLIICDYKLPRMHGLEILKKVKAAGNPGVILTIFQPLVSNYRWSVEFGASYFLPKPFSNAELFELIRRFFQGTLKPAPFAGISSIASEQEACYVPKRYDCASFLKFWGTRGSCSVAGADYARYGGNTPCLEVRSEKDLLIIDAGTGLRPLGQELTNSPFTDFHIFISHTHWDHLAGFTFFPPLFDKKNTLHIWTPVGLIQSTEKLFAQMFSSPFFPARLDDIAAKIIFHDLRDGDVNRIGSIEVATSYAYHPGSTLCFKILAAGKTIGYVTDNEVLMGYHGDPKEIGPRNPLLEPHRRFIDFFRKADIMVHEAQYTPLEYQRKVGWGHSSITNASALIAQIEPKSWVVTHHDPAHTDQEMLKIRQLHSDVAEHLKLQGRIALAFDNFVIPL